MLKGWQAALSERWWECSQTSSWGVCLQREGLELQVKELDLALCAG